MLTTRRKNIHHNDEEMQIQPPGVPPIVVHWFVPEPIFYREWDFWLSVATMLLALITGWLAWETRGLRQDSAKAIRASRNTAKAALAQVNLSKESMHRTLRPYVTIDRITPRQRTSTGIPKEVDVFVINTGQITSQSSGNPPLHMAVGPSTNLIRSILRKIQNLDANHHRRKAISGCPQPLHRP